MGNIIEKKNENENDNIFLNELLYKSYKEQGEGYLEFIETKLDYFRKQKYQDVRSLRLICLFIKAFAKDDSFINKQRKLVNGIK